MAVLGRDEFMTRLQERIGEDTSDDALKFIEDATDTFNDLETRSNGESEEQWKQKYNELDESWRKRYKERFFSTETTPSDVVETQKEDVKDDGEKITFDDLFKEREG